MTVCARVSDCETPIRSDDFRTPRIPDNDRIFLGTGFRWSPTHYMDIDFGYAHLFVQDPGVDVTDKQSRGTNFAELSTLQSISSARL